MSPQIPADIREEINKRLPPKSLIRFRSVCKAWNSLIGGSEFIAAYSLRQTQSHHLLVRYEVGEREETEIKYVSFVDDDTFPRQKFSLVVPPLLKILDDDGSTVIGSSHGLLCFYGHYFEGQKQDVAVIWNPSIKKSIAVVVPNVLDAPFSSVLGFGVCPETGDPTLVKITFVSCWWEMGRRRSYIPGQVLVYSVDSKEWKYPCNNLPRKTISFTRTQTSVGKFIYWFAYDSRFAEDGTFRDYNLILSFDMVTEEFREVNLPDSLVHESFTSFSIFRLKEKESLALLQYSHEYIIHKSMDWKQVCTVWMMEHGDPKSFTKLYTIKPPHAASIQTTLGFRKSGEPIIDMILDYYHQTLVVYEPFSKHIQDLEISINRCSSFVNSYTESLLLLNEEDACIYSL